MRELIGYNPATGEMWWRKARPGVKKGMRCAKPSPDGYVRIKCKGGTFVAHRLIWKMVTGKDPELEIDHRDGNPSNNAWLNLRLATHVQNMSNCVDYRKKSGLPRGVTIATSSRRFAAQIQTKNKLRHIGVYDTPEEAHEAYLEQSRLLHGEFSKQASRA
ncbi:HNH endonuclease [Aurantimonas coralicida]|uniref:HNH endonuclease n=1 Tax=Aurantimonas coralicida TaxID=182270 RepID=UPI00239CFDC5|nr:HNH endonuclease [Aurantimonas coralicida]MDE0924779.1 HNH endonuclease [Aurantimonas coralicida]